MLRIRGYRVTNSVLFRVSGADDGFYVALRRRGWHLTSVAPVYDDPNVIRWRVPFISAIDEWESAGFYDAFGDNTFRKVLRAIIGSVQPRTWAQLHSICGNEKKLNGILGYLIASGIAEIVGDDNSWMKGLEYQHINNIGTTLEWYVAEWFRRELQAPARHGVTLKEVHQGGDLDVIAFVNDICVFVECKTSKPSDISETEIRWFLQRAHDFGPDIAVLLIDTDSPITKPVRLAAQIARELDWLENHPEATKLPAEIREGLVTSGALDGYSVAGYRHLYCIGHNAFITGVPESVDTSLSNALRFYYSYLRHQLIFPTPLEWDFVNGTVRTSGDQPFGVEGQLRAQE